MRRNILILEKIKLLPSLLVVIFFSGVVLYFGLLKTIEVKFSQPRESFKVVLHFNDDNYQNQLLTNLVRSQDSISDLITVERTDLSFNKSDADVYIDVPEDFVNKILDGRNESAKVYFKSQSYYERLIFTNLAISASDILASAQSSIYAAEDLLAAPYINSIRDQLNRELLKFSMERDSVFKSTSDESIFLDFISKGIVLLLLLSLVNIGKFWTASRRQINKSFVLKGYSPLASIFNDWLGFFILYLLIGLAFYFLARHYNFYLNIFGLLMTLIFISLCSVYLSVFASEKSSENILIFIFLISLFSLGLIFPIEILPSSIVKIINLFPQNLWAGAIAGKAYGFLGLVYMPIIFYLTYKGRKI